MTQHNQAKWAIISRGLSTVALLALALSISACESGTVAPEAETGDDQNLVPAQTSNHFDQAAACSKVFQRHAAIRESDMKSGVLRWACGDVPGVTGKDLGQEYCEYKAISAGKVVSKTTEIVGGKVQCLFTSVYADVKPPYGSPAVQAFGKSLATKLKDAANLNATKLTDAEVTALGGAAVMNVGFNTRGAATALVVDCARNAAGAANGQTLSATAMANALKDEARQAACFEASQKIPASAAKFKSACLGKVLADDKVWAPIEKLGARVAKPGEANYETQRDVSACLRSKASGGVTWRNSDPMICTRVTRAVTECSVEFNGLPDSLDGFSFTGWTNKALPKSCRYAVVDGKEYKHLVICEASTSEVSNMAFKAQWKNDLTQFCRDRFAQDIVMEAPIRALQKTGTTEGAFCSTYNNGWK